MILRVKSSLTGDTVEIHDVSRVWFEDGRLWYRKGVDKRMPYEYRFIDVINDQREEVIV